MRLPLFLALAFLAAPNVHAQTPAPAPMTPMRTMPMSSSVDLQDPMAQEASGTAWLPASSPIYAAMKMEPNGDMLMLHGAAMPRYVSSGSTRGDAGWMPRTG